MLTRSAVLLRGLAMLLAAASLGLAGCGNSRTAVPSLAQLAAPLSFRTVHWPAAGLALRVPRTWNVAFGRGSLVSTLSSGSAVVAIWRYGRSAPPPVGAAALRHAALKLLRDGRTTRLIDVQARRIDGAPSVEIDAIEQIAGRERRVRSLHLFRSGAELVLDEYAPPGSFPEVDRGVFSPLIQSLVLTPAT